MKSPSSTSQLSGAGRVPTPDAGPGRVCRALICVDSRSVKGDLPHRRLGSEKQVANEVKQGCSQTSHLQVQRGEVLWRNKSCAGGTKGRRRRLCRRRNQGRCSCRRKRSWSSRVAVRLKRAEVTQGQGDVLGAAFTQHAPGRVAGRAWTAQSRREGQEQVGSIRVA